ncbi:hypothetical protein I7I53_00372 [Histoplasma capsulatum var. duboisii H88]|uniref:Uncharacterized protein n=1 Tax=Ajellomyces capsulatus (strain H88) TaxID=544711 RepID=A0A8A1LL48_AJEC8|nr:hypothetical protein I7I53_00372 [Histoplasma capsulatum var. duboisii H88]
MASYPRKCHYGNAHGYEYPHEHQSHLDTPGSHARNLCFERWKRQYYGNPPDFYVKNPLLPIIDIGYENYSREATNPADRLTEPETIPPLNPNSGPALSNVTFILYGNPFPECNSMADMYRPRFHVYPGAARDAVPELDVRFRHEGPRVVHIDMTKSWKGLSSDKAEELLFWETIFRNVLEFLLHDQLELLLQQCGITALTFHNGEHQRGLSDRIHYLPIGMIDIATAMVTSYSEHRRIYHWLSSMGNIYKTVAQFIRTHDCFVAPTVDKRSFAMTHDLRIGVKLLSSNDCPKGAANRLLGYPVEVNWAPDMLSFDQFDPFTTEGQDFRLVPRYTSSLTFSGADSVLEPRHITYKTSAAWLWWDTSISGFSGTVPTYSDSGDQTVDASGGQSEMFTVRIMVTATSLEYFDTAVRFEKTVRSRVTINVMKRKFPQLNPIPDYTLRLFETGNRECNAGALSPGSGKLRLASPQLKWWDDPFIGPGVYFGARLHSNIQSSAHCNFEQSSHPFDSLCEPFLFATHLHAGLSTPPNDHQIGENKEFSLPAPIDSALRIPPLRRRRRSLHSLKPLKNIPKIDSTVPVPPQTRTYRVRNPQTESGDKRLRQDIINMLDIPLHCSRADEDLEMRYRPWEKRSSWRGAGVSVQKKGSGHPCQDSRLLRNSIFSETNSEEEDASYISKYCQNMRLSSDQLQPRGNKWSREFNFSRTPSSERLTMDCSRFLNSHGDRRPEGESKPDTPRTPPASDTCPCDFVRSSLRSATDMQAGEGCRKLGSDTSDLFGTSLPCTSEGDWEDVDTEEEGVSIPEDEDSDADQTNQGVPIPFRGSSIKDQ